MDQNTQQQLRDIEQENRLKKLEDELILLRAAVKGFNQIELINALQRKYDKLSHKQSDLETRIDTLEKPEKQSLWDLLGWKKKN